MGKRTTCPDERKRRSGKDPERREETLYHPMLRRAHKLSLREPRRGGENGREICCRKESDIRDHIKRKASVCRGRQAFASQMIQKITYR